MEDKNSNVVSHSLAVRCQNYQRINHQALLLDDQALIFGGTGPTQEPIRSILRFNFENAKVEPLFDINSPSIQGFSLFSQLNQVFLWGGFVENKPSNALYSFNGTQFHLHPQNGTIPSPRAFHCSAWIGNRYLLVYGGFNQHSIFNDWHILDSSFWTWHKMEANICLPQNTSFQMGWKNGRGLMMTSETVIKAGTISQVQLKNEIFQLRIVSFSKYQLRIDPVLSIEGGAPPPRANPTLVFTQKLILMFGGQRFNEKSDNVCSDVWSFDLQTLSWTLLFSKSAPQCGSVGLAYKNKIYLFGGILSLKEISNSIDVITFRQTKSLETQVCSFCRSIYGLETKKQDSIELQQTSLKICVRENFDPVASISSSFLSKLAHTLENPLQAFGLLIDNALNMSASTLHMNIQEDQSNFLFLGDNSRPFSCEELTKMMFSFRYRVEKSSADQAYEEEIKIRSQYGLNLKMAALRLGRYCLFVSRVQNSTFISYFSGNSKECPDGQPSFNCFYYTVNSAGIVSNKLDQQIICENVRGILKETQFMDTSKFTTKIYIEGLYDLCKVDEDIAFAPFGVSLNLSSLSDYISKLYLNPVPGREIRVESTKINCIDVSAKFRTDKINGDIEQLETSQEKNIFNKHALYRVRSLAYSPAFVFVYHQNRLITILNSQERMICGFVEVPDMISIDFFRSKLQRYSDKKKLQNYIEEKEGIKKRVRESDQLRNYDRVRKMKPTCLDL